MIRISDAAQAHFAKLLVNQEEGTQIRVFVINPGTPNAECGVSYCPPDAVEDTDTTLKFEQLTAYVDELSAPYLEDAEIGLRDRSAWLPADAESAKRQDA
nr:NfuA Fe-S protein maturation [Raoultella sp. NCTC 9187]